MATTSGRRGYQWLLLLVAAVLLVGWLFVDGGGSDDPGDGGRSTGTSSPTHELTETTTRSADPTTEPSATETTEDTGGDGGVDPESGLPIVQVADLPPEAAETLDLIDAGGPFPEPDHDGGTFENREELLPDQPRGYYREYTVPTPGSDDRGARRIVTGEDGEYYWTDDHYRSFSRIAR